VAGEGGVAETPGDLAEAADTEQLGGGGGGHATSVEQRDKADEGGVLGERAERHRARQREERPAAQHGALQRLSVLLATPGLAPDAPSELEMACS
jgi:hypothetical protein